MHIANISGTLCMYEEYMKRKASQIKKLEAYVRQVEKAEKLREAKRLRAQQQQQQQTTQRNSSTTPSGHPNTNNNRKEDSVTTQTTCPNDCQAHPQCQNCTTQTARGRKRPASTDVTGTRPQTRSQTKRARLSTGNYPTPSQEQTNQMDKES